MANRLLINYRMDPTVIPDVFVKILLWFLMATLAISLGLVVAWFAPNL